MGEPRKKSLFFQKFQLKGRSWRF